VVLLDDPFVLVTRPGDVPEGPYPVAQLNGASLIGYPANVCQQEIEDSLRAYGVIPTFVFRTLDNGAQMAMVRAGMGWAVMPMLCVDTRDRAIDIRPLQPAIPPRQVCLVWRRARTLSPVAARLIEIAREVAADLGSNDLAAIA
jgi:DNA-binding transcriptional LysR family regulator